MTEKLVCKFYNTGYCKFTENCKFDHPKNKCTESPCKNKLCRKRHPKQCRYKDKCRRQISCAFNHDEQINVHNVTDSDLKHLKEEIEKLKKQNNELEDKIKMLDLDELRQELQDLKKQNYKLQDRVTMLESNKGSPNKVGKILTMKKTKEQETKDKFQCSDCQKQFKHETQLQNHISDKHGDNIVETVKLKEAGMSPNQQIQSTELINCPFCSEPFSQKELLINHIKSNHRKRRQVCSLCNEEFKEKHDQECKYLC